MENNEELAKAITYLSQSVKSIQDKLLTLKQGGLTQSGTIPQISSGSQYSSTVASNSLPPSKKLKADDDEYATDEDDEAEDTVLVTLSEERSTSLETAFGSKLENKTRKARAKAQDTPNSQWIRFASGVCKRPTSS